MYSKKKVINILMKRDGLSRKEAEETFNECRKELLNGNYDAIAEICELEDDYIFAFI